MPPKEFRPKAFCAAHGCNGFCPISAVVAGFNNGNRAKCRTCSLPYPKPADVYMWRFADHKQYHQENQANNYNNGNIPDKKHKALEQQLKEQSKQMQQMQQKIKDMEKESDKDAGNKANDDDNQNVDIDKKIADHAVLLANYKSIKPDDKDTVDKLEAELEAMRAKKLQTKPLSTRQINVTRRLERARNHRDALRAQQEAERKRHAETMAKLTDEFDKTESTIKHLEEESQNLLKEAAGNKECAQGHCQRRR